MKTWTYRHNGQAAVVSADNIEMAKHQLGAVGIFNVKNEDLVPLPTHHRYARNLTIIEGQSDGEVQRDT